MILHLENLRIYLLPKMWNNMDEDLSESLLYLLMFKRGKRFYNVPKKDQLNINNLIERLQIRGIKPNEK